VVLPGRGLDGRNEEDGRFHPQGILIARSDRPAGEDGIGIKFLGHAAGAIGQAAGFDRHGTSPRPSGPDPWAAAIAVVSSKRPSQPSSIATAASDAVPTPASTSTGTFRLFDDQANIDRILGYQGLKPDRRPPAA